MTGAFIKKIHKSCQFLFRKINHTLFLQIFLMINVIILKNKMRNVVLIVCAIKLRAKTTIKNILSDAWDKTTNYFGNLFNNDEEEEDEEEKRKRRLGLR